MSNYKDRRSENFSPRGNRERASFNPNFNGDNRLKQRPRFNKSSDERPQFERAGFNGGAAQGRYKRYNAGGFDNNRYG
jgi:hypothetical protein